LTFCREPLCQETGSSGIYGWETVPVGGDDNVCLSFQQLFVEPLSPAFRTILLTFPKKVKDLTIIALFP